MAFKGVWVLPAAAFTENYEFDEESYRHNLDYYLKLGVDGFMVNGSIGEFSSLSDEERKHILEITIKTINGKVPVGTCTSSNNTLQTIELTKHAKKSGADVVMFTPPYYWKPTDAQVIQHYKMVSDAVDIPIMAYNNPFLSKVLLSPDLVGELSKIKNVKYLKETVRDFFNIYRQIKTGLGVFGSDAIFYTVLELGGAGVTISPVRAKEAVAVYREFEKGDMKGALEAQKKILESYIGGEEISKILPWTKAACEIRGIKVGPPRPPYTPLSAEEKSQLKANLQRWGYI